MVAGSEAKRNCRNRVTMMIPPWQGGRNVCLEGHALPHDTAQPKRHDLNDPSSDHPSSTGSFLAPFQGAVASDQISGGSALLHHRLTFFIPSGLMLDSTFTLVRSQTNLTSFEIDQKLMMPLSIAQADLVQRGTGVPSFQSIICDHRASSAVHPHLSATSRISVENTQGATPRRSARPGLLPVCPVLSRTICPFTMTNSMPVL